MSDKDGALCKTVDGSFSVSENYEQYLANLLGLQEALNPISHLKKFELVRGNAMEDDPGLPATAAGNHRFTCDFRLRYLPTHPSGARGHQAAPVQGQRAGV